MLKHRYFTISIIAILLVALIGQVYAAGISPTLTDAGSFSVLAGQTVTNSGTSSIAGDVGVYPGDTTPGLTEAMVGGTIYRGVAHALAAKNDFEAAYDSLSQPCEFTGTFGTFGGGQKDLSALTLVPGVYCADSFLLTGTLTLDGTAADVWIFRAASESNGLTTSGDAPPTVSGPNACNVWWQIVGSATLGTSTVFQGNILAQTSISLATGATLDGRAFAETGEVTLQSNTIDGAACLTASTIVTPTPGPRRTATPGTGLPAFPGTGSGAPIFNEVSPWYLLIIAGILGTALVVGGRSLRKNNQSK